MGNESCILYRLRWRKKLHVLLMRSSCPLELGGLGGPWDPLSWGPGDGLGDGVLSRFLAGIAGDTLCLFAS